MMPRCDSSLNFYEYSYIDLEGNKYGPFDGCKMAYWDREGHMDDDLKIFRISASGKVEEFILGEMKTHSKDPFLEIDSSSTGGYKEDVKVKIQEYDCCSQRSLVSKYNKENGRGDEETSSQLLSDPNQCRVCIEAYLHGSVPVKKIKRTPATKNSSTDSLREYHPDVYPSPPFMRLPDFRFPIMTPEDARRKVFSLYQLIITIPEQLSHFPPYTTETVSCQLCKIDLNGPSMFKHLINIQHLMKVSNCLFTENDIDYWIERVNTVIKGAHVGSISLPGFEPTMNLNETESVSNFINRTKGFARKPSADLLGRPLNVLSTVLDIDAATMFATMNTHKTKRKLSGRFLSRVVNMLIGNTDRTTFKRRFTAPLLKLLEKHNKCQFCDISFGSFYDTCHHIGSSPHREKISNIFYHEGLVATWVRLLASPSMRKQPSSSRLEGTQSTSSLDIMN
ncbi:unnamed protein product [Caenorhabditis nigoni]|uniref:GYF domain-containing protein n=2 Tax=Caenorhabditis nigoni TaxID=1611254 RepID=A0A2G5UGY4_9PELO|nr:hypothetical protein B9Z55_010708 [Caenorhabditis nigoni]